MANVKVLVDVSPELLESVVKPFKARHQFGKLVVKLLEAYDESDSIKEYIDSAMYVDQDSIEQSLFEELNKMKASFDRLDNITGTVKEKAEEGLGYFADQAESEIGGTGLSEKAVRGIIKTEMDELKAYLSELLKGDLKAQKDDLTLFEDAIYEDVVNMVILEEQGSVGGIR